MLLLYLIIHVVIFLHFMKLTVPHSYHTVRVLLIAIRSSCIMTVAGRRLTDEILLECRIHDLPRTSISRMVRQSSSPAVLPDFTHLVAYVTSSFARITRTSSLRVTASRVMGHLHARHARDSARDSRPAIRNHPYRTAPRIISRATLDS